MTLSTADMDACLRELRAWRAERMAQWTAHRESRVAGDIAALDRVITLFEQALLKQPT